MSNAQNEMSEIHRLILMTAAEPDLRSLAARVEGDVDLLREAVVLYAGLQQPGSPTAKRLQQLCQAYDISLPQLVRGLKGIVVGLSPGSDASFLEIDEETDTYSVFEGVEGSDEEPQRVEHLEGQPVSRSRWLRVACGTGAALLLIVLLKVGGAFDVQPVRSDTTQSHVVEASTSKTTTSARRVPIPKKTGSHWIRLAMAAQHPDIVKPVSSPKTVEAKPEGPRREPDLITDVEPLLQHASKPAATPYVTRPQPAVSARPAAKAPLKQASLLRLQGPRVAPGKRPQHSPSGSPSPARAGQEKKQSLHVQGVKASSSKESRRAAVTNQKKAAATSNSDGGVHCVSAPMKARKTLLVSRNDKVEPDSQEMVPKNQDQAPEAQPDSLQAMTMRLKRFLKRYTQAFSNKDLNRFLGFFDPAALENGRPVSELIGQYQANFSKTEWIRYAITMQGWRIEGSRVRLEGVFHLKTKYKGKNTEPASSAGNIVLTLKPVAGGFRVVKLDYSFWR